MSRITKELRIYVADRYAPVPKGYPPQQIQLNVGPWGRFERNRITAQAAWIEAGSPDYGEMSYSAWVSVQFRGRILPTAFGVGNWFGSSMACLRGRCVGFGATVAYNPDYQGIEVVIKREGL